MTSNFEINNYLEKIATRATLHNQTLLKTRQYLIDNSITDHTKIENALVVGQVWASEMYGSALSQHDLLLYLGNDDPPTMDHKNIVLEEKFRNKTLNEVLDIITTDESAA